MTGRTQRWRRVALAAAAVVALATGGWLGVTRTVAGRHFMARSIRTLTGPPAPAQPLSAAPESPLEEVRDLSPAPTTASLDTGQKALPPPEVKRPRKPPGMPGVSFVLLLGMDKSHPKVLGRTDAMIVAAFRHRDGKVAAFSVPRDLYVDLPEYAALEDRTTARINAVARVGDVRLGPGRGLPLLREVLHLELGVRIDHYAMIDFEGFEKLVDHLGGVDVDVQCPIMDCFWVNGTDAPCEMMQIDAGRQHLDGRNALKFVRSRHGTGDRDRTKRQQAILVGFARRARDEGLSGLRDLWKVAEPYIETDLDWQAAAYYASFALENELDDLHGMSIRHPMVNKFVTEDGKHVLKLDTDAYDTAFADLFETPLPGTKARRTCPEPDAALHFRENRRAHR